jgi:hypothetical protein
MKKLILGTLLMALNGAAQVAVELVIPAGFAVTPRIRAASVDQLEEWRKMQPRQRGESVWLIPAARGTYAFEVTRPGDAGPTTVRFVVEGETWRSPRPRRVEFRELKPGSQEIAPGIAMEVE